MAVTPTTVVVGVAPDMGQAQFVSILQGANSPAHPEAATGYNAVVANGVSPAFSLSIFAHESSYGKAGVTPTYNTKNPGNCRSSRTGDYPLVNVPGKGQYVRYPIWTAGWRDLAYRLVDPTYVYVQEGRTTIAEIIARWAPPSDDNNTQAYIDSVVARMNTWGADPQPGEPPMAVNIGNRPLHIAIGAGHRHTLGEKGNPYEADLNGRKVKAFCDLMDRSSGFGVRCYTPNEGLGLYPGYLNQAAAEAVKWDQNGWTVDVFVECHSEGTAPSVRGAFVIYPDSGDDVDEDVKAMGTRMTQAVINRIPDIPLRTGLDIAGCMSEKETGVGAKGFRLGVFRDTAPLAPHCSRFLFEAGAHSNAKDRAVMEKPGFVERHAVGLAEAIVLLARERMGWTGAYRIGGVATPPPPPPPDPEPTPNPPSGVDYPAHMDVGLATRWFGQVTGEDGVTYVYNEQGPVSTLWLSEGKRRGAFSMLEEVQVYDGGARRYFRFDGGMTFFVGGDGIPAVVKD